MEDGVEVVSDVPVVVHEGVEVVGVGVLVDVLAGPVDVGGHVSARSERLVVHVVGLVLAAAEAAVHALGRDEERRFISDGTPPSGCDWAFYEAKKYKFVMWIKKIFWFLA